MKHGPDQSYTEDLTLSSNDSILGGDGNDTLLGANNDDFLDGGTGNDSIDGGNNNDTIFGNTGDDTILGGEGSDSLNGGDGNDSIDGGAGTDTIEGGQGNDTLLGGGSADVITDLTGANSVDGGSGNDTIQLTGDGSNTVFGGTGDDFVQVFVAASASNTVEGGAGNDFLQTGDSTDSISGGADNDTIDVGRGDDIADGGTGDDQLQGFTGNDTLLGGDGDDRIDGGAGNDSLSGGEGFDTFIVSAGDDVISDFNTGAGQDLDDGNQGNNDFVDLAPYYDDLFEMRRDLADDGTLNQSVATDDYGNNTALPGTIRLDGVASDDLTFDNVNLVCFTPGMLLLTPRGARPVESIATGDPVTTLDHGPRPVRWVGHRRIGADPLRRQARLRPIRIRAGALGHGLPLRDLVVSPQHRMLIASPIVRRMFGTDEILVAAKKLVGLPGIERDDDCTDVTYVHLLLDRHEVLFANGAPSESLFTGPMAIGALERAAREEIAELFPDVLDAGHAPGPARIMPRGRAVRNLVMRHARNGRPLLESFFDAEMSRPERVSATSGTAAGPDHGLRAAR